MKIFSYNVNGIRAALGKGLGDWMKTALPDVICFQELKAHPGQFDTEIFDSLGYHQYWMPAEKKGYSGVGLLSRIKPDNVFYGMGMEEYDSEGRLIRVDFGDISIISVYIPSGSSGDARQDFKMKFLGDFSAFISRLVPGRPRLIISGDYNICHKAIDINHPERHKNSSGFLPEERAWFDEFTASGFVDTFRVFDDSPGKYSWWSFRANSRAKNLGWRIDYNLVTEPLRQYLTGAGIDSEAVHSDHCPVWVEISV